MKAKKKISGVEVLLSTYNGAQYLSEQLASLEDQSFKDWLIVARDDGSMDSSKEILNKFAMKHPERVRILNDCGEHVGVCCSYSRLMAETSAHYVMFCDQDDVWLPGKIQKTLSRMKRLEAEKGMEIPSLVHCDLMVADENLASRHNSFWEYQAINPKHSGRFSRQLVMNAVTGCAMMTNRPLLELAMPIPSEAMVHDWWIAQVASAFGETVYVPEPLILYRQHGGNRIGARGYAVPDFINRIWKNLVNKEERRQEAVRTQGQLRQGRAFFKRYESLLSDEQKKIMQNYFTLYAAPPFARFKIMALNGLWRSGLLRNIAMGMRFRYKGDEQLDSGGDT